MMSIAKLIESICKIRKFIIIIIIVILYFPKWLYSKKNTEEKG